MNDGPQIAIPVPPEGAERRLANYFAALRGQGARPVAVRPGADPAAFDGLLLPGGGDIHPRRYGQPNELCDNVDEALDAMQFAALEAFAAAGRPVLGICRGLQLVNVYFGGTLHRHLREANAHSRCGGSEDRVHATVAAPGSLLYALYGERFSVNSAHHQGVDRPGEGLRVIQRSEDGVVEALVHERLPILCVQWHPERMCLDHRRPDTVDGGKLLESFVKGIRQ